jgi:RNA polymerase sigma factor (sigma-70 family)
MGDDELESFIRAHYEDFSTIVKGWWRRYAPWDSPNTEDVEDIVQTAVMKVWERRRSVDPGRVNRYFNAALRNGTVDRLRLRGRVSPDSPRAEREAQSYAAGSAAYQDALDILAKARESMTHAERQAFAVPYLSHLNRQQAIALLGTGYDAALNRARHKVKEACRLHWDVFADIDRTQMAPLLYRVFRCDLPDAAC